MQPLANSHVVNDHGGFSRTKKIIIQTPIRSPVTFSLIPTDLEIIKPILADYISTLFLLTHEPSAIKYKPNSDGLCEANNTRQVYHKTRDGFGVIALRHV
jgi:hypothetical protein